MDKQTPLNLTRIMDSWCKDEREDSRGSGTITEFNFLIEDELWGKNKGVYIPMGYLKLPVTARHDDAYTGEPYKYNLGLFTAFADSFLEEGLLLPRLTHNENSDDLFAYSKGEKDEGWKEGQNLNPGQLIILESGDVYSQQLNLRPAEVVRQHLQDFFKLYEQAKRTEATSESIRCILRCFTHYQKEDIFDYLKE